MAALSTPSIGTIILFLLLILIRSGFTVNDTTASASCNNSHSKKCHLVRDDVADYKLIMMELEMGRMLLDFNKYTTPQTGTANKNSGGSCGRPPRYDSCLGEKRDTPPQEKCYVYKRVPCG
ncbi:hypothetical protein E5676_scaffold575G00600 [Cucumis melo var. makuwa]|uniref:Rapid ALkalinization Factor n=1 Tax=Cucumis melo var. makuwa TaxID=1194695 RepID=A0A5D3E3B8_CUCMM|nr:hypothetical protein E6C27_scaffold708G00860 [Cucumis melo var. makuwa]TYK30382.1 hypothetical protein E5676_scaffold575G00600 [Cucumis melo var. makuwa]